MAKIVCPNKQYTGVSAGVAFANGAGETDNPRLIAWFKRKGYGVVENVENVEEPTPATPSVNPLEGKSVEELKAYAEANGIDTGNASSQNGILKKIMEAQEAAEPEA